MNDNNIIKT